jgi:hypothetical protein
MANDRDKPRRPLEARSPTLEEAEEAARYLSLQVERARKVLQAYRDSLGHPLTDNDNRDDGDAALGAQA